jgi:protein-tyrosine phosphatase
MDKTRILFVCLGNICRSPSAEAIFIKMITDKGIRDEFVIDSAGTSGWHNGDQADRRMQKHALMRGYDLLSLSRKFYADSDFTAFDLIIGMDGDNIANLMALASNGGERAKIVKMTDYCRNYSNFNEVPDPYFGGDAGFEQVLDILEDACANLLEVCIGK